MKKVTITIASKDYTISLEENFAVYFELDMEKFLNENNSVDIKDLLTAYVQKCYESYRQEESIDKIALRIAETVKR